MDTNGIKINSDRKLTDSELEEGIRLIQALPEETFMSVKEGKTKKRGKPDYMKADELDIKYHPDGNYIFIEGKNKRAGKSIGLVSAPKDSLDVSGSKSSINYTYRDTRFSVFLG